MNRLLLTFILASVTSISSNTFASTITQCELPDGSIEFTNQGCSKSNRLHSKRTYSKDLTRSQITISSVKRGKKRKQKAFNQTAFVNIQNKLLSAQDLMEMEKHAQTITNKVEISANKGNISAAYNMIAATYVKISKHLKKKQWEGQSVSEYTFKIRSLFENILITQSTTSTASELSQIIQSAWENYQANS